MKRILISIALPLAIVAVAWQFAPAKGEVPDAVVVEEAESDVEPDGEAAVDVAFEVAVTDIDIGRGCCLTGKLVRRKSQLQTAARSESGLG